MSNFFARTLFAGASVALTVAMVAASATASAAVAVPVHQTVVKFDDLNLASAAGQKTLEHRLNAAADAVCPVDEMAGRFVAQSCRTDAIKQAKSDIAARTVATSSMSPAS